MEYMQVAYLRGGRSSPESLIIFGIPNYETKITLAMSDFGLNGKMNNVELFHFYTKICQRLTNDYGIYILSSGLGYCCNDNKKTDYLKFNILIHSKWLVIIDTPASDPLSHRSIAIQKQFESIVPLEAIVRRSYSDSSNSCVVDKQQRSINAHFCHNNGTAVYSRSLSITSSIIGAAVDSASACLLYRVVRVIKRCRTHLEAFIIVILSVVMVSAPVQIIYESVQSLISYADHFTKNATDLRRIDMEPAPITVMCVTITVLSFLCYQIANPSMYAVAQNHRNDVFSNIVVLASSKALDGLIKVQEIVVIDPVGTILISLHIIFCWLGELREEVRNLSAYKVKPEF
ncbi:unnamed protein product [Rotaria sp. Silwood2]|nr:unnamed protein product [Rotaria sp. Silwood2]